MKKVFARLHRRVGELGWVRLALQAVDRLFSAASHGHVRLVTYVLMAQPIGAWPLAGVRKESQTSVTNVKPGDPLLDQLPRPQDVIERRLKAGADCLVATVKDQVAGMLWIARETYVEDEVRCLYRLTDSRRCVWDFDVYVAPRYRGSRVFFRLWQAANAQLVTEGVEWSFSRISALNTESLAAHRRMGAKSVGKAVFLSIGHLQLSFFSLSPFFHFSSGPQRLPCLDLTTPDEQIHGNGHPQMHVSARTPISPTSQPPAALVLGLDSHGLAVARAMADAGVPVFALERNLQLPGVATNRVRRVFSVPDFTAEYLLPALKHVRAELAAHEQVALMAINDRHVTVIAGHLDELLPLYRISWADQAELILKLQSKSELESISLSQGLNYPHSVLFREAKVPAAAHELRYPVIIKPVRPLSSFKTLLLLEQSGLQEALQRYAHDLPILGQEYIEGDDLCIYFGALMLDHGRVLQGMAGRKIASHPPARGQTTIAESVHAPEVMELTERFFAGMGLSGPVSLELKRDDHGRFWVIEPTVGRTDFWAELCIGAGFNQPLMEYQLACGLPVSAARTAHHVVWYDTERDPLAWLRLCWKERTLQPRNGRQFFPYFGYADIAPLWRAVVKVGAGWIGRRVGREAARSQ